MVIRCQHCDRNVESLAPGSECGVFREEFIGPCPYGTDSKVIKQSIWPVVVEFFISLGLNDRILFWYILLGILWWIFDQPLWMSNRPELIIYAAD